MKVITKVVYKTTDKIGEYILVEEQSFEYSGPVAKCDRALQGQAQNNATTAGATAGGYGASATTAGSALTPFYTQEMKAQHGFTPEQTNEMLDAAMAGSGGAAGAITGEAGLEAARTRNASGFTKTLDEAARDKDKAAAGASEGIASQDVMAAKQLNQEGASGLQGLYGTDVNAQLKAMGQQDEDINTAVKAGQTGWLQNATGVLGTLGQDAEGAGKLLSAVNGN